MLQIRGDDVLRHFQQVEHSLVADPIEHARTDPSRLQHTEPSQRSEVLGRPARIQLKLRLQVTDRAFSVAEQFENPNALRVPEHAQKIGFDRIDRMLMPRHDRSPFEVGLPARYLMSF